MRNCLAVGRRHTSWVEERPFGTDANRQKIHFDCLVAPWCAFVDSLTRFFAFDTVVFDIDDPKCAVRLVSRYLRVLEACKRMLYDLPVDWRRFGGGLGDCRNDPPELGKVLIRRSISTASGTDDLCSSTLDQHLNGLAFRMHGRPAFGSHIGPIPRHLPDRQLWRRLVTTAPARAADLAKGNPQPPITLDTLRRTRFTPTLAESSAAGSAIARCGER